MIKRRIGIGLAIVVVGMQFYRIDTTASPVEATHSIAAVLGAPDDIAAILDRSCKDCHSVNVEWPWYASIAPSSWFVAKHVNEGRHHFNLSDWASLSPRRQAKTLGEIAEEVGEGKMPLKSYLWLHGDARLEESERKRIVEWAVAEREGLQAGLE